MANCGYTPNEIDEMTLHDVNCLFAYWKNFPPTHEILKCIYRIQPKSEFQSNKDTDDPSGIGTLIAQFPGGLVRAGENG